jgi:hypothetical protein
VLHRIRQSRIHKNAVAFFAKHTRFEQSADFAFAVSKKRRKLQGVLREEILLGCAAFFPLRHPERSAAQRAESNGSRSGFSCRVGDFGAAETVFSLSHDKK